MRPWISETSAGFTGRSFILTSTSLDPTSGFWTSWICITIALRQHRDSRPLHTCVWERHELSHLQAFEALGVPSGQLDSFVLA